jgi:hypothetical protein
MIESEFLGTGGFCPPLTTTIFLTTTTGTAHSLFCSHLFLAIAHSNCSLSLSPLCDDLKKKRGKICE